MDSGIVTYICVFVATWLGTLSAMFEFAHAHPMRAIIAANLAVAAVGVLLSIVNMARVR